MPWAMGHDFDPCTHLSQELGNLVDSGGSSPLLAALSAIGPPPSARRVAKQMGETAG